MTKKIQWTILSPRQIAMLLAAASFGAACTSAPPDAARSVAASIPELYEEIEPDDESQVRAEFFETNDFPYILTGELILPEADPASGGVLVSDGRIAAVWTGERPDGLGEDLGLEPGDIVTINTGGIIAPGFIDLHNHVAYNFLPFWDSGRVWSNRYEWARASAYGRAVSEPYGALKRGADLIDEMNKWGEIRGLVGGTTSMLGAAPSQGTGILVRNIDQSTLGEDRIRSWVGQVYGYGCARGKPRCPEQADKIADLKAQLDDGKLIVFHLAEGIDAESREEFNWLSETGLLRDGVVLIHGTALNRTQLRTMARNDVGLVWSPRSNIELYGETSDIVAASEAGVRIALAPDWSPSGSDNLLAELRYAAAYNESELGGHFSARELVTMATATPAVLARRGEQLGRLEPGLVADLVVLQRRDDDAYQSILLSNEAHIRLVVVNGVPLYGWRSYLRRLGKADDFDEIVIRNRRRAIDTDVRSSAGVRNGTQSFEDIRSALAGAYGPFGPLPGIFANDPD